MWTQRTQLFIYTIRIPNYLNYLNYFINLIHLVIRDNDDKLNYV